MFDLPSEYAYTFLTLPFAAVWIVIYIASKPTRKEQLLFSCAGAIAGPLSEIIYFQDYWLPKSAFSLSIGNFPVMAEDFVFGFAIGGIAAVIFEIVFRAKLKKLSGHSKHIAKSWAIAACFGITLSALLALGVNSIFSSAIAFVAAAALLLSYRRDLLLNAVGSGFCVMLVMFASYYLLSILAANTEALLEEQWLLYGTSLDMRIAGIPLTEMAWGFTWGFLAGPLYEFLADRKLVRARKSA